MTSGLALPCRHCRFSVSSRRRHFLPPPPAGRKARALTGEGRGYGVDTSFAAPRAKKREKSAQIRDFLALHSYRPHYSTPVDQAIDRTLLFEMCPCHSPNPPPSTRRPSACRGRGKKKGTRPSASFVYAIAR